MFSLVWLAHRVPHIENFNLALKTRVPGEKWLWQLHLSSSSWKEEASPRTLFLCYFCLVLLSRLYKSIRISINQLRHVHFISLRRVCAKLELFLLWMSGKSYQQNHLDLTFSQRKILFCVSVSLKSLEPVRFTFSSWDTVVVIFF